MFNLTVEYKLRRYSSLAKRIVRSLDLKVNAPPNEAAALRHEPVYKFLIAERDPTNGWDASQRRLAGNVVACGRVNSTLCDSVIQIMLGEWFA